MVIARRGVSPDGAVVLNPLEVAESVLGCLPTVVSYPSPSHMVSGVVPASGMPDVAGGSVVGAFHGTDQYMRVKATKQAELIVANLKRLDAFPSAHSRFFLVRQCIAASLVQSARAHGMSPIFNEYSFAPVDEAVIDMVLKMVSETAFDPVQLRLLSLPLRHGGIGMQRTTQIAAFAWLAGHLKFAEFYRESFPIAHFVNAAISVAHADPRTSRYASMVHEAVDSFADLHSRSTLRPHDDQLDGFVMSVDGLVDIATKFQQRCSLLLGKVSVTTITGMLSPVQRLTFDAHQARGAAAVFVAVPTQLSFPSFTDSMFAYILKRRLLISQFSAASSSTMCNVGGCKCVIGLSHPESCSASGILGRRHEALREVVCAMLSSVGLDCDRVDCTKNVLLTARLQAAKAVNPDGSFVRVGGLVHGADMIVRGLHQPGDEFALDFTVFSEASRDRALASMNPGARRITPKATLADVEAEKVNLYRRMYASINVVVKGLAVNLAGGIGPSLHALIKRCAELSGDLLPPFADWSAPTFVAAWSQRMVIAVQSTNACVALRNFTRALTAAQVGVGGSVDWLLAR